MTEQKKQPFDKSAPAAPNKEKSAPSASQRIGSNPPARGAFPGNHPTPRRRDAGGQRGSSSSSSSRPSTLKTSPTPSRGNRFTSNAPSFSKPRETEPSTLEELLEGFAPDPFESSNSNRDFAETEAGESESPLADLFANKNDSIMDLLGVGEASKSEEEPAAAKTLLDTSDFYQFTEKLSPAEDFAPPSEEDPSSGLFGEQKQATDQKKEEDDSEAPTKEIADPRKQNPFGDFSDAIQKKQSPIIIANSPKQTPPVKPQAPAKSEPAFSTNSGDSWSDAPATNAPKGPAPVDDWSAETSIMEVGQIPVLPPIQEFTRPITENAFQAPSIVEEDTITNPEELKSAAKGLLRTQTDNHSSHRSPLKELHRATEPTAPIEATSQEEDFGTFEPEDEIIAQEGLLSSQFDEVVAKQGSLQSQSSPIVRQVSVRPLRSVSSSTFDSPGMYVYSTAPAESINLAPSNKIDPAKTLGNAVTEAVEVPSEVLNYKPSFNLANPASLLSPRELAPTPAATPPTPKSKRASSEAMMPTMDVAAFDASLLERSVDDGTSDTPDSLPAARPIAPKSRAVHTLSNVANPKPQEEAPKKTGITLGHTLSPNIQVSSPLSLFKKSPPKPDPQATVVPDSKTDLLSSGVPEEDTYPQEELKDHSQADSSAGPKHVIKGPSSQMFFESDSETMIGAFPLVPKTPPSDATAETMMAENPLLLKKHDSAETLAAPDGMRTALDQAQMNNLLASLPSSPVVRSSFTAQTKAEPPSKKQPAPPKKVSRTQTTAPNTLRRYADGLLMTMTGDTISPKEIEGKTCIELPYNSTDILTRIGNYDVLKELGRGAMGVVFQAFSVPLCRMCALKVMIPNDELSEANILRFQNEAMLAAKLRHPNIVSVFDSGEVDGQFYFVMDFVRGQDLDDMIQDNLENGSTNDQEWIERGVAIIAKAARAMHHAHENGIVHRDIKPENILVDRNDEPYIADFGIAKSLDQNLGLTKARALMGTPYYMSPEQANGEISRIGPASDIYSLGATLYHFLAGRAPFVNDDLFSLLLQILEDEPQAPRKVAKSKLGRIFPKELDIICLKALEKNSKDRYPTAKDLAEDLEAFLEDRPLKAQKSSVVDSARKLLRRNRKAFAGVTVVLTILTLLAVAFGSLLSANLTQTNQSLVALDRTAAHNQAATLERAIRSSMLEGRADIVRRMISRLRRDPSITSIEVVRTDKTYAYTDLNTRKWVEKRLKDPKVIAWIKKTRPHMLKKVKQIQSIGFDSIDQSMDEELRILKKRTKLENKFQKRLQVNKKVWDDVLYYTYQRTFTETIKGQKVLTVLWPIHNSRECMTCHGKPTGKGGYGSKGKIRAVLVVRRSQKALEDQIRKNRENTYRIGGTTTLAFLLFLFLFVKLFGIRLRPREYGRKSDSSKKKKRKK